VTPRSTPSARVATIAMLSRASGGCVAAMAISHADTESSPTPDAVAAAPASTPRANRPARGRPRANIRSSGVRGRRPHVPRVEHSPIPPLTE
jgi:hypothetical protein